MCQSFVGISFRRSLHPFGVKALLIEPGGFKTRPDYTDVIAATFSRAWDKAAPEVKAEFGEDYFRACEYRNNLRVSR